MNNFKKISLVLLPLLVLSIIFFIFIKNNAEYTVLKIQDGDTVYIDLNNNGIPEKQERKDLSDIVAFKSKAEYKLRRQMREYNLTQQEVLELGYLAKELLKEKALNKKVKVKFTDKRKYYVLLYLNGKLIQDSLIKSGFVVPYKRSGWYEDDEQLVQKAKKQLKNRELVILNLSNHKYHKPDCKYGVLTKDYELIEKKDLPEDAESCDYCFKEPKYMKKSKKKSSTEIVPEINLNTDIKTGVKLLFNSPVEFNMKPSDVSRTHAGKVLIEEINKLDNDILRIATYGFAGQPELLNVFINAEKRGNKILGITDVNVYNKNAYGDTFYVIKEFGDWKTDYEVDKANAKKNNRHYFNGNLMHNKFVILGKTKVWTGSTNLSNSGTGGLNANLSALITSPRLTYAFIQEHKQMYGKGKFHTTKTPYHIKNIELDDGSKVSAYFCPNPDVIDEIVSMISGAKKYVYVAMFFLTNDRVIEALQDAYKKGIDIKLILDASACQEVYSKHHRIREAGIPTKVENWTGKMHMKTIIVDDRIFTLGSMNATSTAEKYNDENIVFIENPKLAKKLRTIFESLFKNIPEKWLTKTPKAESPESGNSCHDGLDNDHDWKYDAIDSDCASAYR